MISFKIFFYSKLWIISGSWGSGKAPRSNFGHPEEVFNSRSARPPSHLKKEFLVKYTKLLLSLIHI